MKVVILLTLLVAGCSGLEKRNSIKHIVGGYEAEECEFPHVAHLSIKLSTGPTICGGTLIDPFHILTAAHCIYNTGAITAYLGHADHKKAPLAIKAKRWIFHEGFAITDTGVLNDIGMIRLEKPVKFSRCVKPISLPSEGQVFSGTCIAAGWGMIKTGENGPDHMKKAPIDIIPTQKCQKIYYGITVDQHICVGDMSPMGKNICLGDSGGPLTCKQGRKDFVAGVASYVFDCEIGFAVFANVASHLDWVKEAQRSL